MVVHLGHHWLYKLEYNIHNPFKGFYVLSNEIIRKKTLIFSDFLSKNLILSTKSGATNDKKRFDLSHIITPYHMAHDMVMPYGMFHMIWTIFDG